MECGEAKARGREWVLTQGVRLPEFYGAFFHGSILEQEEDALISPSSDVDIMVVVDGTEPSTKLGKLLFREVMLEVSYVSLDALRDAERVLGNYRLAPSFKSFGVILDPSGDLTRLYQVVSKEYARPEWIRKRCLHARDNVLANLRSLSESAPLYDQVAAWLFGAGVMTHVLLVAGLKNPTVRRRYVEVRKLLVEHGRGDVYERLLELLGCAEMSASEVGRRLASLADVFDVAKTAVKTPFFFATDISDLARPIAIDGSLEMIRRGDHREAVFWIVATYCRCLKILATDAPERLVQRHWGGFHDLLADLDIGSYADLERRSRSIEEALPTVLEVAESLIARHPSP